MSEKTNISMGKNELTDGDKIELKDILDTEAIQSFMDDFYALTNFGIGILDLHGEVLIGTGWQEICVKFHRVHPLTLNNCLQSDTYLSRNVKRGEFLEYKCKNNLRDIVTPIFVSDQHVGNLFLGQFMYEDEVPEIEVFENQGDMYGFDKEAYLNALSQVPKWSREKVNIVMNLYSKFAQIISNLLTSNLAMERALEDKKRSEAAKVKLIEELNRSNKELEQFAYVTSHDLQEPLRMISAFTSRLEREYNKLLDKKAGEYMSFITEGAKKMQVLIKDLLEYSRISGSKRVIEDINSNILVSNVLNNLGLQIQESGAQVFYNTLPVIKGDPVLLALLFQNLISNAIKFCGKNIPEVNIKCEDKKLEWLFSIHDNGIGISPEYFEKIFMIFQRLHDRGKYEGTGIGLTICNRIVERHGGRIWVESEPGKGSVFYFSISKIS